ncbi:MULTISPECIES: hypothetical protein [Shewanella]|uniref:hypothetical protein n=1 Tax=Shewanella TaxID=22 RepID=UPI0004B76E69|nr:MULTISPECIES: hypothetical protein [Shewanella]QLE84519.1 hypothetical protein FLM48_05080 [Shewanella sp. Scap07]
MLIKLIKANLIVALIVLTGCASTSESDSQHANTSTETTENSDAENQKSARYAGYRCEKVAKTGSRIKTKQCSTQAQRDAAELAAKELLDQGRRSSRLIEN